MKYAKIECLNSNLETVEFSVPVKDLADFHKLCREWGMAVKERGCIMMPYVICEEGYADTIGTLALKADDIFTMTYSEDDSQPLLYDTEGKVIGVVEDCP